jgi:hypothetical protein
MIPTNEMGVIVLFSQQCEAYGFEILSIGAAFPDAIVEKNGVTYRVEFEFSAGNFIEHKHDQRSCDLIVCWDGGRDNIVLPILRLSDENWGTCCLDLPNETERNLAYWRQRALIAERALSTEKTLHPSIVYKSKMSEMSECKFCHTPGTQGWVNGHRAFCKDNPANQPVLVGTR